MQKSKISNWIRQSRYKYKSTTGNEGNIELEEVMAIIEEYKQNCAYCLKEKATTLTHPLSIQEGGPCISANILPACSQCKRKIPDIIVSFLQDHIDDNTYMRIIKEIICRDDQDIIKQYIKQSTCI